jgi:hypothetical protein
LTYNTCDCILVRLTLKVKMKLTNYSHNLLLETFAKWDVPKDFADPMYNYLVHGYSPGGFFTSVLANDFHGAIARSHPGNTIEALKHLGGWMLDCAPRESHSSYTVVERWLTMQPEARRTILEECGLIYTEEKEVMLSLKGTTTVEPNLY